MMGHPSESSPAPEVRIKGRTVTIHIGLLSAKAVRVVESTARGMGQIKQVIREGDTLICQTQVRAGEPLRQLREKLCKMIADALEDLKIQSAWGMTTTPPAQRGSNRAKLNRH